MNSPRQTELEALPGAASASPSAAFEDTVDGREPEPTEGLPPVEADPRAINYQRQTLLARMFGTKSEPNRLDRYELREELGRGGMGVVYKAHDPKLNRLVAIKLITKDDPMMRDRFRREAQAIAKVKHPNVIDIYDTDFDENQRPYITMEYVDGQTVKAWLQESSQDIYDIFKVFAAAGRGLEIVHQHGIVHHDFKPENVLIGKDGRVLVADFGLARATLASADEESLAGKYDDKDTGKHDDKDAFKVNITQTGALLGTLHYMAPELLDKSRGDIRTDQFAFCVSLYEALTGERFFQFQGKAMREVYEEILRCQIKPLPRANKVPRAVEAALRKGLSVRPADRHASMKDLTALLERVSKRPERLRWFTWAAIIFVAILALVGAFVLTRAIIDRSSDIPGFDSGAGSLVSAIELPRHQPDPVDAAASVVEETPVPAPALEPEPEPESESESESEEAPPEPLEPLEDPAPAPAPKPKPKPKPSKPVLVQVKLHAGDFDTADFDFGALGKRTISTGETIDLPATTINVKCREYDANVPRQWKDQTLDLSAGKRKISCSKLVGPNLR